MERIMKRFIHKVFRDMYGQIQVSSDEGEKEKGGDQNKKGRYDPINDPSIHGPSVRQM